MLTHPKSTLCILRILMHLSWGHVALLRGEFQLPDGFTAPGRLALGSASNFYFYFVYFRPIAPFAAGLTEKNLFRVKFKLFKQKCHINCKNCKNFGGDRLNSLTFLLLNYGPGLYNSLLLLHRQPFFSPIGLYCLV